MPRGVITNNCDEIGRREEKITDALLTQISNDDVLLLADIFLL